MNKFENISLHNIKEGEDIYLKQNNQYFRVTVGGFSPNKNVFIEGFVDDKNGDAKLLLGFRSPDELFIKN